MGVPNVPIRCTNTGLTHFCYPANYAPEKVVLRYSGMTKGSDWIPTMPEPKIFELTLLYWSANLYVYMDTEIECEWAAYSGYSQIDFYALGIGQMATAWLVGEMCPIVFAGFDNGTAPFCGGTFEIKERRICFLGPHPWDVGDLAVVPHDADIFSEATQSDDTTKVTRYARHRDGTNVKIRSEI